MNEFTTNLPTVISTSPDSCNAPAVPANAEGETNRNNPAQLENSLSRRPAPEETEWHKGERSQNSFSSQPDGDEPEWNDPERSQNSLAPLDEGESEWDELERFQNSFRRETAADQTRWHELEHFHIPHSEYLCERQQLAIRLLLIGEREGKVAQKVGIGRTTLWRRRKDNHFRDALAACRNLAYANAMERLGGLVSRAVDRIEEQIEQRDRLAPFRVIRLARADRPQPSEDAE